MAPPAADGRAFGPLFERWSSRVRRRLALGHVLTGAAVGLLVGAGSSAALWQTRHGTLRPAGVAAGLLGAAAGVAVARRRRWADGDVALYLDARLDSDEAIVTAVELQKKPNMDEDSARAVVVSQAASALARATPRAVRAPLFRPLHAALPAGAAAIAWISVAPLPRPPPGPEAPPGAGEVQVAQVAGLEKVVKLADMNARDAAQRERLKKLADDARKLRDKLKQGVEKREAQDEIARLKDGIVEERLSLGEGEQRQGMESALGKLGENPELKSAQKALGDRDLVRLDEEMERLANKLEKADRERARKTLEEAEEAARLAASPDVARALAAEKRRLAEQGKKTDRLRELARALGDALDQEGRQALRDMNRSGAGKDAQRLAEKLDEALGKLTPEQRRQLAENLRKQMREAPEDEMGPGPSKRELRELADKLDTPEGRKQLEEELRRMAEAPPEGSEEGERQKGLDDAEEGAEEAQKQLGGIPLPLPMPGQGDEPGRSGPKGSGSKGSGSKEGGSNSGSGKGELEAGHTEGGGPGSHKGVTGVVEGGEMRARAAGRLGRGKPMPGMVMGRSAGRAGETANVLGEGALGAAAAGEMGGVERSDVPDEYREQVGRYFQTHSGGLASSPSK
jgi:hypothetical protein